MRNYVQPGDTIAVTTLAVDAIGPDYGYIAGRGYIFGKLFGVAMNTTLEGQPNELVVRGVFEFPTTDNSIVIGDRAYYVTSIHEILNVPPFGLDTFEIGVIVGQTATGVQVRLNGIAIDPAGA